MSVAYRASASASSATVIPTVALTPAVGDLFVVFCSSIGLNLTQTCTDNNGGTYTRITSGSYGGAQLSYSMFVRDTLMVNTTPTTVTVSSGGSEAEVAVIAFSGMLRSGPSAIRQLAVVLNTSSTAPAATFASNALTTNAIVSGIASSGCGPATTADSGLTVKQRGSTAIPVGQVAATIDSGFTSTTITWSNLVGRPSSAVFTAELDSSAVPTGGLPNVRIGGSFSTKPLAVKIAGAFATKPLLVKKSGTFVNVT